MNRELNKAIFIDKDGTLIPDLPYNTDPALINLEEHVADGLRSLQANGFLLVIISNQSGVAMGYFQEEKLKAVRNRIEQLLELQNIHLDGFYYCPHHPEGIIQEYTADCTCRKPKPGLLLEAASQLNIDLSESWMIGDILNDVEAGNKAGCRTVLINNGNETEWIMAEERTPLYMARTINEAAGFILKEHLNPV